MFKIWTGHNFNDRVRVQLTPTGVDILKDYWYMGFPEFVKVAIKTRVLEEQLWRVMKIFGPHVHMGMKEPIEMVFEIEEERL